MAKISENDVAEIVSYFVVVLDGFSISQNMVESMNKELAVTTTLCIDVTGRDVIDLNSIAKITNFLNERKLFCGLKSMFPGKVTFFIVKL